MIVAIEQHEEFKERLEHEQMLPNQHPDWSVAKYEKTRYKCNADSPSPFLTPFHALPMYGE